MLSEISEELKEKFKMALYDLNSEGDGYFFTGYTCADYMPDEKSTELFQKALEAIKEFRGYIEEKAEENE